MYPKTLALSFALELRTDIVPDTGPVIVSAFAVAANNITNTKVPRILRRFECCTMDSPRN